MYTQKKPIENIHIVRERDRQRFRELTAVLCIGLPIGAFLLLFTWQNLEVIRLGHETTRLQKTHKEIEDSNKALQLELDRMTSLAGVEQKATALGFAPSAPQAIVMVSGAAPASGAESGAAPASGAETHGAEERGGRSGRRSTEAPPPP